MARVIHLTKAAVLDLSVTGTRYYVSDDQIPGLVLCVSAMGRKTFELIKKVKRRARRMTLGAFPEMGVELARRMAQQQLGQLAAGVNVFDDNVGSQELTLGELHRRYIEEHSKPTKRTWKDDVDLFTRYWQPWRNWPLSDVTRAELQSRHRSLSKEAPVGANRGLALIRQMFNWAARMDLWTGQNPAALVTSNREKSRDRFLQPDEMSRFLQSVEQCSSHNVRDYVSLSLMLGARQSNMLAMRWDQLSFDRSEWRIPETKNGEPQIVHLPPSAIAVLQDRQPLTEGSDWVFPAASKCGHLVEPKKAWATILRRAGIENLRLHDLRRTLGSWQASAGTSLQVIGKSLGHKSLEATAIYARLNLDPVRSSVNEAVAAMLATRTTRDSGAPMGSTELRTTGLQSGDANVDSGPL